MSDKRPSELYVSIQIRSIGDIQLARHCFKTLFEVTCFVRIPDSLRNQESCNGRMSPRDAIAASFERKFGGAGDSSAVGGGRYVSYREINPMSWDSPEQRWAKFYFGTGAMIART